MDVNSSVQTTLSEKSVSLWRGYAGIIRDLFRMLSQWCTTTTMWLGLILPGVFINILSLAFPLVLLQVYDRVVPQQSAPTLVFLLLGGIIATIIAMILSILRSVSINWTNTRFEYFTNLRVFNRMLSCQLDEFQKQGSGYYLKRMDDITSIKDYYFSQVLTNVLDLPFVILFIALIAYVTTYLALIPSLMIVSLLLSTSWRLKGLSEHVKKKHDEDSRRWSFLANIFMGSKTLKAMGSEPLMLRRYERLLNKSLEENKSVNRIISSVQGASHLVQYGTVGLVILIGGSFLLASKMSLGSLAASVLLSGRAIGPVQRMISLWQQYQSIPLAKESLEGLESFPVEEAAETSEAKAAEVTKGDIVFDHVTFYYEENNPILKDLNLHVAPGEVVGVTGTNYSGKSTFLELILGFHTLVEGQLLIDGRKVESYDKNKLREKIAYLPVQGQLFRGTLLENLTMFRADRREKALALSDQFGLSELIWPLPEGFDTVVGGGFSEVLSKGVVQVISVIRALISEPKILLSDEANAQLDLKTDQLFLKILKTLKGSCTMIVVSHRPSTLALADRQYELVKGHLMLKTTSTESKNDGKS